MFFLSDISKVQDDEVGDGTTSVTVLAAELLRVKTPPSYLFLFYLYYYFFIFLNQISVMVRMLFT